MAVSPSGTDLQRLLDHDPDEPVVMLNLLRFQPDGGRESYDEYGRQAGEVVRRYGGEVLYYGTGSTALVAEPGQEWDAVVLVATVPDRVLRMIADPDYHGPPLSAVPGAHRGGLQATVERSA